MKNPRASTRTPTKNGISEEWARPAFRRSRRRFPQRLADLPDDFWDDAEVVVSPAVDFLQTLQDGFSDFEFVFFLGV